MVFLITLQKEHYELMEESYLLDPVQILFGSKQPLVQDAALISKGSIKAFGDEARKIGKELNLQSQEASQMLLAPCLVDPHSILEQPFNEIGENLTTLKKAAANAGYGQIALMPRSSVWRDLPEHLQGYTNNSNSVSIHLWGSFSQQGEGKQLAPHADLLKNGAIGLADDDSIIPIQLLKQGLELGEMGKKPILLSPRDSEIQGNGISKEGVETLRAGWIPDPLSTETIPLSQILELHKQHPEKNIRLINISTTKGVLLIKESETKPIASVSWWHLIADTALLSSSDIGWRVTPSLGGPKDRQSLIDGLRNNYLSAIAVNAIPLDEEQTQQPTEQRIPGLSGHQLVLPSLWKELIVNSGFTVEKLWDALSFSPSKMMQLPEEFLSCGSRRWLLFDPNKKWIQNRFEEDLPSAANQPWQGRSILGKVIDCGLKDL